MALLQQLDGLVWVILGGLVTAFIGWMFTLVWKKRPPHGKFFPRLWAGAKMSRGPALVAGGVLVMSVLVIVAARVVPAPTDPQTSPPQSSSPAPGGCLEYVGDDELLWQAEYADEDFALTDCSQPHQFEILDRDADLTCDQAGTAAIDRGSMHFQTRVLFRELGPSGCAVGRYLSNVVETDNFRISKSESPISTFGACIDAADFDGYVASGEHGPIVACERGTVLITGILLTESDASVECAERADQIPSTRVGSGESRLDEGDRGVRCALQLKYSD